MKSKPREVAYDKRTNRPYFKDTDTPTGQFICQHCGRYVDTRYPDPCLGKLPGVEYACCGHGNRWQAYVKFKNGLIIRGFIDEEIWMKELSKKLRFRNLYLRIKVTLHRSKNKLAKLIIK